MRVMPLRAVVGIVFAVHGAQKLFSFGLVGSPGFLESLGIPVPTVSAAVLIAVGLLGGLALLIDAGTRIVAMMLAGQVSVAMLTVHVRGGFFVPDGIEFVLTLFGAWLALAGLGAGPWWVDGVRRREKGRTARK